MKKVLISIFIFIALLFVASSVTAMTHYQTVDTPTGLVTASALNVRQGPGTNFDVVTLVYKNEYIRLFAKIGDWYVVQTDDDYIGMVSSKYVKKIYPTGGASDNTQNSEGSTNQTTSALTEDEQEVFNLINEKRKANGLSLLVMDDELQNVARVKAKDMVDNNYFSHNSPTYGTPFEMIKSFGITYKAAGENIAGNSSNIGAVNAWMNSEGHRANILSNNYNYTGVAVVNSPVYGKVYVQMFMGK